MKCSHPDDSQHEIIDAYFGEVMVCDDCGKLMVDEPPVRGGFMDDPDDFYQVESEARLE